MNKSGTRVLGTYQFDYGSIKNRNKGVGAATPEAKGSNTHVTNKGAIQQKLRLGEAELWQLNQVVQEQKRGNPNVEFVLHAKRIKGGAKTGQIRLYHRPKEECEKAGFLAKMQSVREQRLAAEVIARLASTFKSSSRELTASCPTLAASLESLTKPSASLTTNFLSAHLQNVAIKIETAKLDSSTKPMPAKQIDVRNKLRKELHDFYDSNTPTVDLKKALYDLASFNFQSEEIKAFQELVSNVNNGRESSQEDLYAIQKFRTQWVAISDSGTVEGKKFREFTRENPEYHAFSMVAYGLENRPAPMFDLSLYAGFDVVMLPMIEQMQPLNDPAEQEVVKKLHADSKPYASKKLGKSIFKKQTLVAAERCVIAPEQVKLLPNQQIHLLKNYTKVIADSGDLDQKVILTPLFNYTENTIDDCVKHMLRPVKMAWEQEKKTGKGNLKVDIFSSDPRISKKFYEALRDLKTELTETKNKKTNANVDPLARRQIVADPEPNELGLDTPMERAAMIDGIAQDFVNVESLKHQVSMVARSNPVAAVTAVVKQSVEDLESQFKAIGLPQYEEADKTGNDEVRPGTLETVGQTAQTLDGNLSTVLKPNGALGEYDAAPLSSALREQVEKLRMETESPQVNQTRMQRKVQKSRRVVREATITGIAATAMQPIEIRKINQLTDRQGIEKITLQIGMTEHDWLPDKDTVLLLTESAMECIQPNQMHLKPKLESLLNDEIFSAFAEIESIFKRHNLEPGKDRNRYIAAVKHLPISGGLLLSNLTATQAERIIHTYATAVEAAQKTGIRNMVLTPCFSMPGIGNQNACKQAIAIMLKTLDELSTSFAELDIALVARSEAEHALMENAIETLRQQKRNQ